MSTKPKAESNEDIIIDAPVPVDLSKLSVTDLIALMKAASGNDDASMQKRAAYEAEAHQRLNDRENRNYPDISVYSYPEGNFKRPKPTLKCRMYQCGYPVNTDNLSPAEIDALNRLVPGEYGYTKTDGSRSKITVKAQRDSEGVLTQIEFNYPCRGIDRHNQPSLPAMLNEALGFETSEVARLKAELMALRAAVTHETPVPA